MLSWIDRLPRTWRSQVAASPRTDPDLGRLRVALATLDAVHVNAGVETASSFVLYDVTRDAARFVGLLGVSEAARGRAGDGLGRRLRALADCDLVYAIEGARPARGLGGRALSRHVVVSRPATIAGVVGDIQASLRGR